MSDPFSFITRPPVIPVLTIEQAADAVPLARALVEGGLPVLEVTLRTDAALAALAAIARDVPEAVVGAGTVTKPEDIARAVDAGARYLVSPGTPPALAEALTAAPLPAVPGCATVTEAMALAARGFSLLKFFPAEACGGVAWLNAVVAPLPQMRFCPTGGIGANNAAAYLALPNVAAVGGSWVAPKEALASGDLARIRMLARDAAALKA
ncbi:MAG TPA: bifunctional 4-hydroxy-2-oxoglutarate aldolase/2-dehydro-3-deoxy-phosphogluconate aldolase [Xanthobacteraceae bacterium]|nr:bifunctional 4-hydroxy-2-oxoglutarate aldolase/2-dehydro-3-deoxy-phosphogluconate aldolase [Xanthobacteraceae bacterium]